jgi:hypothetical protein
VIDPVAKSRMRLRAASERSLEKRDGAEVDGVSGQNCHWAPCRNGINFTDIMGDYKGRVKLRQRKKRFAKDQRIKALAATRKGTTPPQGAAEQ